MKLKNMTLPTLQDNLIKALHKMNRLDKLKLRQARRIGRYCLEVKRRLGHGKFKPWLRKNFDVSYPTLSAYMRVALHWEDEDIQAKLKNNEITSINTFLDALSDKTDKPKPDHPNLTPKQREEWKESCDYIVQRFQEELQGGLLEPADINLIACHFEDILPDVIDFIAKGAKKPYAKAS